MIANTVNVPVVLGDRDYTIAIGRGLLSAAGEGLREAGRALLVTDSHVDGLYGDACATAWRHRGWTVDRVVVSAGEASKSLRQLEALCERAADLGLDRRGVVVALGGGVVGDLAGLLAAIYLRGVRLVQVPTSLLAMVDSSVGGKTGVNLAAGKNLVGAFYQPVHVLADLACLDTLPRRDYVSGLAEVIKYGMIWDGELFARLERDMPALLERDEQILAATIARCCEIKAEVVALDERESGIREILNFGHTLAHGIEAALGYGTWLHGEAVAAGMELAGCLSVALKEWDAAEHDRLRALLSAAGLPGLTHPAIRGLDWTVLRAAMAADKKARGGRLRWVLAERIGGVVYGCEVDESVLRDVFMSGTAGGK